VGRPLAVADAEAIAGPVRRLRESIDALFRKPAGGEPIDARELAALLRDCAEALDGRDELLARPDAPFGRSEDPLPFETALAVSALSLLTGAHFRKVKICPSCTWLFLDKSRNSSRLWCDMAVCGNQEKARQHYRRQRLQREEADG
jgi:predicted RNA-binding Zn ribbon-like protein